MGFYVVEGPGNRRCRVFYVNGTFDLWKQSVVGGHNDDLLVLESAREFFVSSAQPASVEPDHGWKVFCSGRHVYVQFASLGCVIIIAWLVWGAVFYVC